MRNIRLEGRLQLDRSVPVLIQYRPCCVGNQLEQVLVLVIRQRDRSRYRLQIRVDLIILYTRIGQNIHSQVVIRSPVRVVLPLVVLRCLIVQQTHSREFCLLVIAGPCFQRHLATRDQIHRSVREPSSIVVLDLLLLLQIVDEGVRVILCEASSDILHSKRELLGRKRCADVADRVLALCAEKRLVVEAEAKSEEDLMDPHALVPSDHRHG